MEFLDLRHGSNAIGWLKIKSAAKYADCSERLFRDWIKDGLRHIRYHGTIRTKPEWIDEFLEGYVVVNKKLDSIVDEVCDEIM